MLRLNPDARPTASQVVDALKDINGDQLFSI